ncbi:MAG: hypothetical protein P1U81_20155, partial [Verrucomicrobiales bacterium]|nr:hypothetical protein [Verrucomicrobiales bacterium]
SMAMTLHAEPTSTSFTLLSAETGAAGGTATSASFSVDTVTGSAVAGGVSNITTGGVQAKGGYTGQLYDATSLAVSADPAATVNEGDAVQLSALVTMDDDTTLATTDVAWSVQDGPATVNADGLAIGGTVTADAAATVRGTLDAVFGELSLSVINLPYASSPITWTDPASGGNGPYRVLFGTDPGSLVEVATPGVNFYNPGQLDMGTTYFYQIFDSENNDLTPGGQGPASFATSLFRPDMRIGTKGLPSSHRGNDIYNLTGGGQLASIKMKGKKKGKVYFSVENDGDAIDDHTVRGTKASKKFKFIKYFRVSDVRANITAAAIKTGYVQEDVAPGDIVSYEIQAKANGKKRASQTLKIGATSASDSRGSDLAKSKLKGLVKK